MTNEIEYNYLDQKPIRTLIEQTNSLEETALIFDSITLWKTNRQINLVGKKAEDIFCNLQEIKSLNYIEGHEELVRSTVKELIELNGIRLPMASTILNFYNELLPICDQRAYREAFDKDYPFTKKEFKENHKYYNQKTKEEMYVDMYMEYIEKCRKLVKDKLEGQMFILNGKPTTVNERNIDKYLYAADKKRGKPVRH